MMALTKKQQEIVKNNLQAYLNNFEPIRIEKEDYGKGFYVFQGEDTSYIQYCYDVNYLDGWLYGAVQAKCKVIRAKEISESV
jgi:hypothetical protein